MLHVIKIHYTSVNNMHSTIMTVYCSLFICLLAGLCKCYWLDLHDQNEKMGLGPTLMPLNFESDLGHCLDAKKVKDADFPTYLLLSCFLNIIHALAEVWSVQVLFYFIWHYLISLCPNSIFTINWKTQLILNSGGCYRRSCQKSQENLTATEKNTLDLNQVNKS